MNNRLLTVYLLVAVLLAASIFLTTFTANLRLPDNQQGYEPIQPIAYSHRLHAGELGINCQHCHFAAERGRTAGIPPASSCMNCHKFVTASIVDVKAEEALATKENRKPRLLISAELRKVYDAFGLDDGLKPDPAKPKKPLEWVRVHSLPSFVYFNHSAHVNRGVECQACHGQVETMERVRQVADLSMGWCVNCHRDVNANGVAGKKVNATTDCVAYHH